MLIRKLEQTVRRALADMKGLDIAVLNTRARSPLFDRLVVVSGTSNRHVRALAQHVVEKVRAAGGEVIGMEGEASGEWVLVDLGAMVVHVMQPAVRAYYDLESLWQAAERGTALTAHPPAAREHAG